MSGFPLEKLFTRYPWLGPLMVACVVLIWVCVDGYFGDIPS